MATRRWSINKGDRSKDVVEAVGAAVATKSLELTLDLAANFKQEEVLEQLDFIREYIVRNNKWPPA